MNANDSLNFFRVNSNTLMIQWPNEINQSINQDIVAFDQLIQSHNHSKFLIETVIAYCSLTLYLKDDVDLKELIPELSNLYQMSLKKQSTSTIWNIPVCYDSSFGLDLQQLADSKSLSVDAVIQLHCRPLYHVYFLGFLPGFPYLGGLDKSLKTPRLVSPRVKIPKGSVAIGGSQTGIYPTESPGGWNIIGQTPIELFDVKRSPPTFIQAGDKVKFIPIKIDEFNRLADTVRKQTFNLEDLKGD